MVITNTCLLLTATIQELIARIEALEGAAP
jgi:hypothetical protein